MPYIDKGIAKTLDPGIEALIDRIHKTGELNYVISCLAVGLVNSRGVSYSTLSAVRAVFRDADEEFYRHLMVPYENAKANEPTNVGVGEIYYP